MFDEKCNKFHAYQLYVIVCYSYVLDVTRMLLVEWSFSHDHLSSPFFVCLALFFISHTEPLFINDVIILDYTLFKTRQPYHTLLAVP